MHLHIIEHDTAIADRISGNLDVPYHRITYSGDVDRAWGRLSQEQPDLILLDFAVPNNINLILKIRNSPGSAVARIPLIVVGSGLSAKRVAKLKKEGVQEYIDVAELTPDYLAAFFPSNTGRS